MSRPRIRKSQRYISHPPSSPANHLPNPSIPNSPSRRSRYAFIPVTPRRHLRTQPLIFTANGQALSQQPHLPQPVDQIGLLEPLLDSMTPTPIPLAEGVLNAPPEITQSKHHQKCLNQHHRWVSDVIPRCIKPYMCLVRQTSNLRILHLFMTEFVLA